MDSGPFLAGRQQGVQVPNWTTRTPPPQQTHQDHTHTPDVHSEQPSLCLRGSIRCNSCLDCASFSHTSAEAMIGSHGILHTLKPLLPVKKQKQAVGPPPGYHLPRKATSV